MGVQPAGPAARRRAARPHALAALAAAGLVALVVASMAPVAGCSFDDRGRAGHPDDPDAGPTADAAGEVIGGAQCAPGQDGCACIPDPGPTGCFHSYGGRYGEGACSPGFQCCDGAWVSGHDVCGTCTCQGDPTVGCGTTAQTCFADYAADVSALPDRVATDMVGKSWHDGIGCPALDDLRLVTLPFWGFDGQIHQGHLVVAATVASDVVSAFRTLYMEQFPIRRMERVDHFDGDDEASMEADNTSAFNCRQVTGGGGLSQHSYGTAVDINPIENPYVAGDTVLPPAGSSYLTRTPLTPGMIGRPGTVTRAFEAIGWGWGGDWTGGVRDYQHLSQSGL